MHKCFNNTRWDSRCLHFTRQFSYSTKYIHTHEHQASVGGIQQLQKWGGSDVLGTMWASRSSVLMIPDPRSSWCQHLGIMLLSPGKETESCSQGLPCCVYSGCEDTPSCRFRISSLIATLRYLTIIYFLYLLPSAQMVRENSLSIEGPLSSHRQPCCISFTLYFVAHCREV